MSSAKTKKRKRKERESPDVELKKAWAIGLKLFKPIGKTIKQTVSPSKNIKRSLFGGKIKTKRRRRRKSRKIKKRRRKTKKRRK
tara:strand:+ start:725 stop:976 length:252 start_codon:yes stop_codon:yes gene_type:complete